MKAIGKFWDDLKEPALEREVPGSLPIGFLGFLISIVASIFFVLNGTNLAYGDALSHLTIARRLFDSIGNTGLGQLGTVWLPAPHLLLSPLTYPMILWTTGWSAAILGAVCMGVTAASIYRIMARWNVVRIGRVLAVFVVVFNPSFLYLCSTALTEPVLIAALASAFAGLSTWASIHNSHTAGEIAIFAGVPATVAVLSRYEGWALTLAGAATMLGIMLARKEKIWKIVKDLTGFLFLPVLAILWWIAFNWVVFHDPFAFFLGEYSANSLQSGLVDQGLTTKGNFILTFMTLGEAASGTVGGPLLIICGIFLIIFIVFMEKTVSKVFFLLLTSVAYVFMMVSLFLGQAVVFNSVSSSTGNVWNNRYGMSAILFISCIIGLGLDSLVKFLIRKSQVFGNLFKTILGSLLILGVLGQSIWIIQDFENRSLVYYEAISQLNGSQGPREAAKWLGENYNGGNILLDESVAQNNILPIVGLPLSEFYLKANTLEFASAIEDPKTQVRWIWASTGDAGKSDTITQKVLTLPDFSQHYVLAKEFPGVQIYKRYA